MTALADRLLEQLHRLGSMSAGSVPLTFGVTEDEAGAVITELLNDKRAYRAGSRIFASTSSSSTAIAQGPAGPQRQVKGPPAPPPRPATHAQQKSAAKPAQIQETAKVASNKKVCSQCTVAKPATTEFFYKHPASRDGLDPACKVCKSAAAKARSKDRASAAAPKKKAASKVSGGGVNAKPKSAAPLRPSEPTGAPSIEDLAVIHIAAGFRLGPLHKTAAGLVHMPHYVDVSFGQLLELATLAKAVKE